MRSSLRAKFVRAAVAAIGLAGLSTVAHAGLVVDLVPTGGTGDALINGKTVTVGTAGDVIHFNIVATVSGADAAANEGMQTAFGSAVSTPGSGGAQGNFSAAVPVSPFNGANSFGGTVQDLNGLPGLDVGSNNAASSADWIELRSNSSTAGTGASDTSTFLLGTIDFTVTAAPGAGSTTTLSWLPRAGGATTAGGIWTQDGQVANNTTGTLAGHGGSYTGGSAVSIVAAPEPGSLALLGLGGLGLLLRRRRAM